MENTLDAYALIKVKLLPGDDFGRARYHRKIRLPEEVGSLCGCVKDLCKVLQRFDLALDSRVEIQFAYHDPFQPGTDDGRSQGDHVDQRLDQTVTVNVSGELSQITKQLDSGFTSAENRYRDFRKGIQRKSRNLSTNLARD